MKKKVMGGHQHHRQKALRSNLHLITTYALHVTVKKMLGGWHTVISILTIIAAAAAATMALWAAGNIILFSYPIIINAVQCLCKEHYPKMILTSMFVGIIM